MIQEDPSIQAHFENVAEQQVHNNVAANDFFRFDQKTFLQELTIRHTRLNVKGGQRVDIGDVSV